MTALIFQRLTPGTWIKLLRGFQINDGTVFREGEVLRVRRVDGDAVTCYDPFVQHRWVRNLRREDVEVLLPWT